MSKRKQGQSKKGLPKIKRITNKEKKRVWLVNGEEILTLREVIAKYRR
jgi:hypothetical protein